jgi:hypothetical protein
MKIKCWNEYDRLKTIILGNVYDIDRVPKIYEGKDQESFQKIVEQTHKELHNIKLILEQHGVTVLQPSQPLTYSDVESEAQRQHSPLINMRDFHMAYGNIFFMTYGSYSHRRYQHFWLEDIVNNFIDNDNYIINANEPCIVKQEWLDKKTRGANWQKAYLEVFKHKNLLHTASILKHNKIAFMSENPGSPIGTKWIKNWLKVLGVSDFRYVTFSGHIDHYNSILNKNTILTRDTQNLAWSCFDNIIEVPNRADELYELFEIPSIKEKLTNPTDWLYELQGHFQDFCAEANALSINPETVMLIFYDKEFYKRLKNIYGITAIYTPWINRYWWGGGLHCITCDIERTLD